jgi:hypothetical protein
MVSGTAWGAVSSVFGKAVLAGVIVAAVVFGARHASARL